MYSFYIQNYYDENGVYQTDETQIYSVPVSEGEDLILIDPVIKCEMGKAGSFEFTVQPNHEFYSCWVQMKTVMRVEYESNTIFHGRVLTIDNTVLGQRKIHCEGDLAFLLDSMQEGTKENKRTEVSLNSYLSSLITAHNQQMDEGDNTFKKFYLGEVPGNYSESVSAAQQIKNETKKYGNDSWDTTSGALEKIQKESGGYFRTRYVIKNKVGKCYLDWYDSYFNENVNQQEIEIGENLIDVSSSTEVDNIFTALIPLGSKNGEPLTIEGYKTEIHGNNKRILVPQLTQIFKASELNQGYHTFSDYDTAVQKYGIIYKVQNFQNADTQEKLWDYATDWMKNNYFGGITSFSVTAMDLHHVDELEQQFFVGDRVKIIYPNMDESTDEKKEYYERIMTITQITYYPHDPEKNQFTIGIPSSILNKTYGTANSKGGGGGASNPPDNGDSDTLKYIKQRHEQLSPLVWKYIYDRYDNPNDDIVQNYLKVNPDADKTGGIFAMAHLALTNWLSGNPTQQIPNAWLSDGKMTFMSGTVFQQDVPDEDKNLLKSLVVDGKKHGLTFFENPLQSPTTGRFIIPKPATTIDVDKDKGAQLSMFSNTVIDDAGNVIDTIRNVYANGLDGAVNSVTSAWGLNAEEPKFDPKKKDKDGNPIPPEQQDSSKTIYANGRTGEVSIGKEPANAEHPVEGDNKWMIKLNDTVTYKDKDGHTQTKKGFVTVKDLNLPEIPSFTTKIAAIEYITSKAITTENLSAKFAELVDVNMVNAFATKMSTIALTVSKFTVTSGSLTVGSSRSASWQQLRYKNHDGIDSVMWVLGSS